MRVLQTLLHCLPLPMTIVAKRLLQTDGAKDQHFDAAE